MVPAPEGSGDARDAVPAPAPAPSIREEPVPLPPPEPLPVVSTPETSKAGEQEVPPITDVYDSKWQ